MFSSKETDHCTSSSKAERDAVSGQNSEPVGLESYPGQEITNAFKDEVNRRQQSCIGLPDVYLYDSKTEPGRDGDARGYFLELRLLCEGKKLSLDAQVVEKQVAEVRDCLDALATLSAGKQAKKFRLPIEKYPDGSYGIDGGRMKIGADGKSVTDKDGKSVGTIKVGEQPGSVVILQENGNSATIKKDGTVIFHEKDEEEETTVTVPFDERNGLIPFMKKIEIKNELGTETTLHYSQRPGDVVKLDNGSVVTLGEDGTVTIKQKDGTQHCIDKKCNLTITRPDGTVEKVPFEKKTRDEVGKTRSHSKVTFPDGTEVQLMRGRIEDLIVKGPAGEKTAVSVQHPYYDFKFSNPPKKR